MHTFLNLSALLLLMTLVAGLTYEAVGAIERAGEHQTLGAW